MKTFLEIVESLKLPFDEPTANFTFVVALIPIIGLCTVSLIFVIEEYYEKVSKKLDSVWGIVFFYLTSFIIGLIVWLGFWNLIN